MSDDKTGFVAFGPGDTKSPDTSRLLVKVDNSAALRARIAELERDQHGLLNRMDQMAKTIDFQRLQLDTIQCYCAQTPGRTPTPQDPGWSVALGAVVEVIREAVWLVADEGEGALRVAEWVQRADAFLARWRDAKEEETDG